MTNLMLCVGRRAATPFEWEALEVRVCNMEELCFQLLRNRYVIGPEAFTPELFEWIDKECGIKDLADVLRRYAAKGGSVHDMAKAVLEFVKYNTPEEIAETLRVLKDSSDMDIYEKHLARADFLVESEHYSQALDAYDRLLKSTDKSDTDKKERLLIAEGVMNARMFCFTRAAELFREAYEMSHDQNVYLRYLAAMRMQMSEKEYLDYIADDAKAYQLSMPLEAAISEAEEAYGKSEEHQTIKRLMQQKANGQTSEYYELVHSLTEDLKREYRGSAGVVAKD